MVVINLDPSAVLASLAEMKSRYQEAAAKGFAEAGQMIVDLFRRDWLSGRGGDGLGLNIQTGRLFQSIRSVTVVKGNVITSEVFNRGADYWYFHQHPEGGRHQYLYLEEAFQEDGGPIYEGQVDQALRAIA